MGLDARLRTARLCVITDAREQQDFDRFVDACFAGGADIIQVRVGDMDRKRSLELLERARAIAFSYQGLVVVDGDAELAGTFMSDVLHLGAADGPSVPARKLLHQWALLGRSTHSVEQLCAALADEVVNYFWVGPVWTFEPNLKGVAPGLELVREAARLAPPGDPKGKPWFAVGGITADNLEQVVEAGARRVGVSSAVTHAADPEAACHHLKGVLRQAWQHDPEMDKYLFEVFNASSPSAGFNTPDVGTVTGPTVGEAEGLGRPLDAPIGSDGLPADGRPACEP